MKKLLLSIFITFIFYGSFSQPIINRAGSANTTQDGRGMWLYNAFMPRYADTVAANLQKGIDTAGAIIYTYNVNSIWYRQNSPKKWVLLSNGNAPVYTADRGVKIITGDVIRLTDTVEGAGTKLQWLYDLAAFRAGEVSGTQWDVANIGQYSFASGQNNIANGAWTFSIGYGNESSGNYSATIGAANTASGTYATAIGSGSNASGATSFAAGESLIVSGNNATSFGTTNIASGAVSTATGNFTRAVGNNSFSGGVGTYMNTLNGFVVGAYNDTTNYYLNNVSTQVATDPIFTIGNGSGVGVRANAFEMLRNGATKFSSGITATTDTTTFKPVVMDASGNLRKVGNWGLGGWSLTGNTGTSSTNFLGTIDKQPLVFKVNNQKAGRIDTLENTFFGYGAGKTNATGFVNTAIGDDALSLNSAGNYNTAIGSSALYNTIGNINLGVGFTALYNNTDGYRNTAIGASGTLFYNTTGHHNTALGDSSLLGNTVGIYNTVVGANAEVLSNNLTNATAIGAKAAVNSSNSIVIGSINGVNNATVDAKVGIGTTTPSERLDVVGNLKLTGKFITPSGADAIAGIATLVAGTATVLTNKISTGSVVIVCKNTLGGITGTITVESANIVDGVSFTITSGSALETSTVNWFIINQ